MNPAQHANKNLACISVFSAHCTCTHTQILYFVFYFWNADDDDDDDKCTARISHIRHNGELLILYVYCYYYSLVCINSPMKLTIYYFSSHSIVVVVVVVVYFYSLS